MKLWCMLLSCWLSWGIFKLARSAASESIQLLKYMDPLQQLLSVVKKEEGEKYAEFSPPPNADETKPEQEAPAPTPPAEAKHPSPVKQEPKPAPPVQAKPAGPQEASKPQAASEAAEAAPKQAVEPAEIQGVKEESKEEPSSQLSEGLLSFKAHGAGGGKQKKVNIVGQKKVISKVDKRSNKKKNQEEDTGKDTTLFSFEKLLPPNKRAAPINPHRQAMPQSIFKHNNESAGGGSLSNSFEKPQQSPKQEEPAASSNTDKVPPAVSVAPPAQAQPEPSAKSSKIQDLLNKVLEAQDKQIGRINALERQMLKTQTAPQIEKMEKRILSKIQDHAEACVRKALEKLPDSLAHKVNQSVLKQLQDIMEKGFTDTVSKVMLPSLEGLVNELTPAIVEPVTKLLRILKMRVQDEDARSASLEKFFMQTIDALESAVEQLEQHHESQREYFDQLRKELMDPEDKKEDKEGAKTGTAGAAQQHLQAKNASSDTRSARGQTLSPFTPREALFTSSSSLHERDIPHVSSPLPGDDRSEVANYLKLKQYQQALEKATRSKKEELILDTLDQIPDKLGTVTPKALGEAFRFLSSNWQPNASGDLGKKIVFLKQLQVFKDC